jgi:hypothetical protein
MKKRFLLLIMLVSLGNALCFGQKTYEMVVEKTDGTETVIPVSDIVRTYFREVSNSGDQGGDQGGGQGGGQDIVGIWIMDDEVNHRYSCGWKFNSDGKCVFGEWMYKGTPRFREDDLGLPSWSVSGNILYISAGSESASFTYTITDGGNTLVLVATSTGDDYSEMAGTYKRSV